ncbi:MAG: ABC transporter permease [Ilumatobacteraceae bacterium]|nr:ABC transporter permease [Ilumatobacteraceae bacterium]
MTAAITIARSSAPEERAQFSDMYGSADLVAFVPLDDVAAYANLAPSGARAVEVLSTRTQLTAPEQTLDAVEFRVMPFDDPIIDGIVDLTDGRTPRGGTEALLSPDVADQLAVEIGDTVELVRPSGMYEFVGLGTLTQAPDTALFAMADFPRERLRDDRLNARTLVDFPNDPSPEQLDQYRSLGALIAPRLQPEINDGTSADVPAVALAWGWVAGALALAAVGVIATAAFASSTGRQLVTVGQLSANGSTTGLIRRTLALQGSWTGAFGSLTAIAIALIALRLTPTEFFEQLMGRRISSWRIDFVALTAIAVTGIGAATIAAAIPARTAARIPTLTALAGRRPAGVVPRRLIPTGLTLFTAGTGLLVIVAAASADNTGTAAANVLAALAVLGGLAVIAGMCCASPLAIDAIGHVGARLPGIYRLGSRSIARSRTRNAGALTAIALTGATAIAATTAVSSTLLVDHNQPPLVPNDTVIINSLATQSQPDGSQIVQPLDIEPALLAAVEQIVPDAEISTRRIAIADTSEQPARHMQFTLADDATLEMLGLSDNDKAAFEQTGTITNQPWMVVNDADRLDFPIQQDGQLRSIEAAVPRDPLDSLAGSWAAIMSEQQAIALDLTIIDSGIVLRSPEPLTNSQLHELDELQSRWIAGLDAFVEPGDQARPATDPNTWVEQNLTYNTQPTQFPQALVDGIAVSVALVLTLLIVAAALALAATESRDERNILMAIGASPSTLRRLAAIKALVLAMSAALMAIPTGFIPTAATITATNDNPIAFPWATTLGLLIAVPALTAVAALGGSTLTHRRQNRNLATPAND